MKRVSGNTQKTALDRRQQRGKHRCDRTWRSALTKEMRPIPGIGLIPAEDAGHADHRWGLGFLRNVYLKFSLGQDQVAKNKSFPASWVSHMRTPQTWPMRFQWGASYGGIRVKSDEKNKNPISALH